jgi:hypothetical protein
VNGGVQASNVIFTGNQAVGANGISSTSPTLGQNATGGAIYSQFFRITLFNCLFTTNQALGGVGGAYSGVGPVSGDGANGGTSYGGAIYSESGATMVNCTFIGNKASGGGGGAAGPGGGTAGNGGNAIGGAISDIADGLNLSNCVFLGNSAVSGTCPGLRSISYYRGTAQGGALNEVGGSMNIFNTSFISNSVLGSSVTGGGICNSGDNEVNISNCTFLANSIFADASSIYYNSSGGSAIGGGFYNDGVITTISDSTFASNSVTGGPAVTLSLTESGGPAEGGGIYNDGSMSIERCAFTANTATGGIGGYGINAGPPGGPGGTSQGGGIYNGDTLSLVNCTLANNAAVGGPGNPFFGLSNPGGNGFGGALYDLSDPNNNGVGVAGSIVITNCTLSANKALGGIGGPPGGSGPTGTGTAGNTFPASGTIQLINTIITAGIPANNSGALTDLGHNISSDASCAFSATGSLNNTDPLLSALGNYGGPTQTIPLLPGSPAIDAADDSAAPPTDQRGFPRPFGGHSDIGAFEVSPSFIIRGTISGPTLRSEVTVEVGSTPVTTTNGLYALGNLAAGTYSITPSSPDYVFVPASNIATIPPDQLTANFRAYRTNCISLDSATNSTLHLVFSGTNNQSIRLLLSTNLPNWTPISTNSIGSSNYFETFIPIVTNSGPHFYSIASP